MCKYRLTSVNIGKHEQKWVNMGENARVNSAKHIQTQVNIG